MRYALAILALPLAACAAPAPTPQTPAADAAWTVIEDEPTFRDRVVGRTFSYGNGLQITIMPDGTFRGDGVSGEWEWLDGQSCRTITIPGRDFPYECQTVEIRGDRVRFLRADGTYSEPETVG